MASWACKPTKLVYFLLNEEEAALAQGTNIKRDNYHYHARA